MQNFNQYLQNQFGLEEGTVSVCTELARMKTLKKGEILVNSGEICKDFFFVEKGLLKQYFLDKNGKEHILYFAPENWLLGDRNSAYFNKPTEFIIEAIEDTEVLILEVSFFVKLSLKFPEVAFDADLLLHKHIRQLQKRVSQLLGATAEERYLDFITTYPNMMQRVPQWMIASYLGITPESLSRVRRELAKKNFLID
ncbi:Crp/Fnr family transcriptional regulator [Elizabethkingia sp. JS20170427COW]|uniref:Crp/Fnr family transcriptional regulator n=1 Tax=Elizabethkingia sp. JS20170427COW TaxID=2583851 RepID=UPI0011101B8A|nr:Crp/Fnr family transcriptional regulator [Elizabethkingia sp. JS20170427COW]QCX53870.1 Crp/Fnr family transcriptional regulator [Elizabethkingia sp. JS20170427COW]